jgi:hypothetical protein
MNFLLQEGPTFLGIPNQLLVAMILGGFGILACISAYAAQRWAHRCYLELQKMNESLDDMKSGTHLGPPPGPSSYLDSNDSETP